MKDNDFLSLIYHQHGYHDVTRAIDLYELATDNCGQSFFYFYSILHAIMLQFIELISLG